MKNQKLIFLLFSLGLFLLINADPRITGAVINIPLSSGISSFVGSVFIIIAGFLFISIDDIVNDGTKKKKEKDVVLKYRVKDVPKRNLEFHYTRHVNADYARKRGWGDTEKQREANIKRVIKNARVVKLARDQYPSYKNGKKSYALALVYFVVGKENQYVIRDINGKLLQLSDLNNPFWGYRKSKGDFIYLGKSRRNLRMFSGRHINESDSDWKNRRRTYRRLRKQELEEKLGEEISDLRLMEEANKKRLEKRKNKAHNRKQ